MMLKKVLANGHTPKAALSRLRVSSTRPVMAARWFSNDGGSKQGMTKEEIEKLVEFQKMIKSQNVYKLSGVSASWSIMLRKVIKWSLILFAVAVLLPSLERDSKGQWKLRLISRKAS